MTSSRHVRWAVVAAVAAAAFGDAGFTPLHAQGTLEARYNATIGGVPLGTGTWTLDIRKNEFTAAVNAATVGILRIFASGKGTSVARGPVKGGQPMATTYTSSIITDRKYDEVRMVMNGHTVKEFLAEPPTPPNPQRIPLTPAHRRGVVDPMTASLLKVPGTGSTFVPEACAHNLAIFDGRMRYDLRLSFKRLDQVRSQKGYQGTAVVCAVRFAPVAGHIPQRPVIKYLVKLRDMELWLAPVAGTRLMVPYRVQIPTPLGLGILQATEFLTAPQTARASSVKPQ